MNILLKKDMKKPTILIIEDNANLVFTLQTFLETAEYNTIAVYDGASGLEKAQSKNINLILLDIGLPDISGIELLEKIREFNNKPIIIISSNYTLPNKISSFENKVNIFHEKPIHYELLKAQIDSLINQKKKKNEIIKIDKHIAVDLTNNLAYIDGKEVSLTNKEFTLLNILLRHRGESLTRRNLMLILDPLDKLNNESSINTTVCRLRKKLSISQENGIIETVNGRGYRIKKQEEKG